MEIVLLNIALFSEDWNGITVLEYQTDTGVKRSLLQIARAFDGGWYFSLLWRNFYYYEEQK